MQRPGEDSEPKKPRRRVTPKGTGSRADWSFCSKDKPCGDKEGDCDADDQCQEGHECGIDNCITFHDDAHRLADCCVITASSGNYALDDNRTETLDLGDNFRVCGWLYHNKFYGGLRGWVPITDGANLNRFFDDAVSSFTVSSGCMMWLYHDKDEQGEYFADCRDVSQLSRKDDDKFSSVKCLCP